MWFRKLVFLSCCSIILTSQLVAQDTKTFQSPCPIYKKTKKGPAIFHPFIGIFSKVFGMGKPHGDISWPPHVDRLTLDRGIIQIPSTDIGNEKPIVDVMTEASDPENDILTYNYEIAAGQIIGTGPKVKWDLTGSSPGIYSIRSWVDDGMGDCGKSMTQIVQLVKDPQK